jgi:ABC-type spermidine/putrescine transport system permease subunit II
VNAGVLENKTMGARFRVARNPDQDSRLPFLVYLPIDGGIVLKARDVWPRAARVYCAQAKTPWDESGGLVDEAAVLACKRRGAAIDLVLDRPKLARSQFVFTNALAGYAFARLNFPGRTVLFLAVLATLMIPLQVTLIPKFIIMKQFGLINTYPGVILPNISTAAGIFLMTQFMKAIPHELEEAAVMDGATKWTVFTRVILPLSIPAMTALAIFSFQGQWNDFLWPLVILNDPTLFTLPLGIAGFSTEFVQNTNWVLVGSIFTTLPMVLLVFFFQRYIIKSVATTGGK